MGSFKIRLHPSVEAEMRAVPFPFRRQINQRIMRLKEEPLPENAELISEAEKYSLNAHGWRVVYEVDDVRKLVTVCAVLKV
jgi:mRNA-degrading endonuclease RelE of RelBE toxin-antitoxin system